MKNIFVRPTDQLTSVLYGKDDKYKLANSTMGMDWFISSAGYKPKHVYITSSEEIKEGDKGWLLENNGITINVCEFDCSKGLGGIYKSDKKIVLTTDPILIADGVQAIDDKFLEWFVKNPTCEKVKIESWETKGEWELEYKIIIPQEEPNQNQDPCNLCGKTLREQMKGCYEITCHRQFLNKQETLDEAAEKEFPLIDTEWCRTGDCEEENLHLLGHRKSFIKGAKWQAERMYSEEEVFSILDKVFHMYASNHRKDAKEWFEQFKKKQHGRI